MQLVMPLTADPGVASLFTARSHTFVEIDHEIISTAILLLPLIQERLLSVTSEVCAQSTGKPLNQACAGKSLVGRTDRLNMIIAVD